MQATVTCVEFSHTPVAPYCHHVAFRRGSPLLVNVGKISTGNSACFSTVLNYARPILHARQLLVAVAGTRPNAIIAVWAGGIKHLPRTTHPSNRLPQRCIMSSPLFTGDIISRLISDHRSAFPPNFSHSRFRVISVCFKLRVISESGCEHCYVMLRDSLVSDPVRV